MQFGQYKPLGNTDPICPYCSVGLDKMPGRKIKCPHCGRSILVRTKPGDKKRVVITEKDAVEIERQWQSKQIDRGFEEYLQSKKEFAECKTLLAKKSGGEPSDGDVFWALYNDQLQKYSEDNNWGLYRNTRYEMARLMIRESRLRPALQTLLEISYLDANGPQNLSGYSGHGYPAFDPRTGAQASGILTQIVEMAASLGISKRELEVEFIKVAAEICERLKLPLSPEKAWQTIGDRIFSSNL